MSSLSQSHSYPDPSVPVVPEQRHNEHSSAVAPSEIAVGVIIGRASEYFDFFVYGIASVLVFPAVFFPFASRLVSSWAVRFSCWVCPR